MRLLAVLLLLIGAPAAAQSVSVLTYHRFSPDRSSGATTVSTPVFAAQIERIATLGIAVVPLRAVFDGRALPGRAVAITADDGHRSVYTEMYPILKARRLPFTLFINPPGIGGGSYLRWAELAEMTASGLADIEAHTMSHPDFRATRGRLGADAFAAFVQRELEEPRRVLGARLGVSADILAWPYGNSDAGLVAAAEAAGYAAAFALGGEAARPGAPRFAIPRYQVYEGDLGARLDAVLGGVPRRRK